MMSDRNGHFTITEAWRVWLFRFVPTIYVPTEYGIVNLKGKSVAQRANALISIAHPDFQSSLEQQAFEAKLIPKRFSI